MQALAGAVAALRPQTGNEAGAGSEHTSDEGRLREREGLGLERRSLRATF